VLQARPQGTECIGIGGRCAFEDGRNGGNETILVPRVGIDRDLESAPKGIRIAVASVLGDTRTTKLLTLLGEEFSAGRVGALFFGRCLPQLFDHQKGVAVHRFGIVFEDLYRKTILPDSGIDVHAHCFGSWPREFRAVAFPSYT